MVFIWIYKSPNFDVDVPVRSTRSQYPQLQEIIQILENSCFYLETNANFLISWNYLLRLSECLIMLFQQYLSSKCKMTLNEDRHRQLWYYVNIPRTFWRKPRRIIHSKLSSYSHEVGGLSIYVPGEHPLWPTTQHRNLNSAWEILTIYSIILILILF